MEKCPAQGLALMAEPRFLIVRFSAIGDCVMAAWAATAIREKYPSAFLGWAVESRCAAVIDRTELTSRVFEFPRDRWKRKRWSPATWREQMLAYLKLRDLKFDVGYDLQGHSKTALCLKIANPGKRVAARATDSMAAHLNPVLGEPAPDEHTVEWNHRAISSVEPFLLPRQPLMPQVEGPRNSNLATISVSAGQPNKAYPAEQWREVAEGLVRQGMDVQFLGGPTDRPVEVPGTTDWVGKLPLGKTMALVARSAVHLAGDTGTGHMAAAYGTPVVSVFGPTNPHTYRPFSDRARVLRCSNVTSDVAPSDILNAVQELLAVPH
jgi:ADP-heptose:LPS heptosyltransferase